MIKNRLYLLHNNSGLTLIELIISMTVSLTIIAATYQLFYSQNQSYLRQDQVIETQQNLRAIMAVLTRELQLAGYNPNGRGNPGIVTQFPPPHDSFIIDYQTDKSMIGFTIDYNGDGIIKPEENEMVAYKLSNKSLERYNSKESKWSTLSNNIDALDFVYLDENGNRTYDSQNFKAIELSILAKTNKKDKSLKNSKLHKNKQGEILCPSCTNDQHHRRLISTTLQIRNLNLQKAHD